MLTQDLLGHLSRAAHPRTGRGGHQRLHGVPVRQLTRARLAHPRYVAHATLRQLITDGIVFDIVPPSRIRINTPELEKAGQSHDGALYPVQGLLELKVSLKSCAGSNGRAHPWALEPSWAAGGVRRSVLRNKWHKRGRGGGHESSTKAAKIIKEPRGN